MNEMRLPVSVQKVADTQMAVMAATRSACLMHNMMLSRQIVVITDRRRAAHSRHDALDLPHIRDSFIFTSVHSHLFHSICPLKIMFIYCIAFY